MKSKRPLFTDSRGKREVVPGLRPVPDFSETELNTEIMVSGRSTLGGEGVDVVRHPEFHSRTLTVVAVVDL